MLFINRCFAENNCIFAFVDITILSSMDFCQKKKLNILICATQQFKTVVKFYYDFFEIGAKIISIFLFRERGREGEGEGEKH